jgi:hypothetical protein
MLSHQIDKISSLCCILGALSLNTTDVDFIVNYTFQILVNIKVHFFNLIVGVLLHLFDLRTHLAKRRHDTFIFPSEVFDELNCVRELCVNLLNCFLFVLVLAEEDLDRIGCSVDSLILFSLISSGFCSYALFFFKCLFELVNLFLKILCNVLRSIHGFLFNFFEDFLFSCKSVSMTEFILEKFDFFCAEYISTGNIPLNLITSAATTSSVASTTPGVLLSSFHWRYLHIYHAGHCPHLSHRHDHVHVWHLTTSSHLSEIVNSCVDNGSRCSCSSSRSWSSLGRLCCSIT